MLLHPTYTHRLPPGGHLQLQGRQIQWAILLIRQQLRGRRSSKHHVQEKERRRQRAAGKSGGEILGLSLSFSPAVHGSRSGRRERSFTPSESHSPGCWFTLRQKKYSYSEYSKPLIKYRYVCAWKSYFLPDRKYVQKKYIFFSDD